MPNLNVSQLNQIVQTGDTQKLFSNSSEFSREPKVESPKTFSELLSDSLEKVNTYQVEADTAVKELISGRNKNIHETMLTLERADTSLKLMMQVRNKILDAYKEIMKMQA
jgi:flagellar hook-basal body complex protein FliE